MSDGTQTRRYRKRKRAIQQEETRRKITEVVVELHGTVGPANTTVTEIADRAGVSRMTVYNYFPDEAALFEACSSHWIARHPFPDPAAWTGIEDTDERLRTGLEQLYRWYRDAADMMANVLRDAPLVPAVGAVMDAQWWPYVDRVVDALAAAESSDERRTTLRVVVDFRTWQILNGAGLDAKQSVGLAVRMVDCAAAAPR